MKCIFPFVVLTLFTACYGDDSRQCGPATELVNGVCTGYVQCGPGTRQMSGECVPVGPSGTAERGPGTTLVDGECVVSPEGLCFGNTSWDPDLGNCQPDPSLCAAGLVLQDGQCVDPASVPAMYVEGAEPNDGPSLGVVIETAAAATVSGCITPAAGPDIDSFYVEVMEPTLFEVTVDGHGGMLGGFLITSNDGMLPHWNRTGLSSANNIADREVYAPSAGTYRIDVADTRTLLLGLAAGDDETCYRMTVRELPLPSPEPTQPGALVNYAYTGQVRRFRWEPTPGSTEVTLFAAGSTASLVPGAVLETADGQVQTEVPNQPVRIGAAATPGLAFADFLADPIEAIGAAPELTVTLSAATAVQPPTGGLTLALPPSGDGHYLYADSAADSVADSVSTVTIGHSEGAAG